MPRLDLYLPIYPHCPLNQATWGCGCRIREEGKVLRDAESWAMVMGRVAIEFGFRVHPL